MLSNINIPLLTDYNTSEIWYLSFCS
jgi:hypothetical protein